MRINVIRSFAKINIGLNVTGTRKDGFHELDMVMVPLQLHDTMIFTDVPRSHDNITIDDFSIQLSRNNLIEKAVQIFNKKTGIDKHFSIYVHKITPIKGGLGGGSSNAASTLLLLNKRNKTNLSNKELEELAIQLGSDVPFFIENKPKRCTGVGEKMVDVDIKNDYFVLLVKPKDGCSTKDVFTKCDDLSLKTYDIDKVVEALNKGDDGMLEQYLGNSLLEPAITFVPEIETIINLLKSKGLKIVSMTGSGSCVFALSTNKKLLKSLIPELEDKYEVILTKILK